VSTTVASPKLARKEKMRERKDTVEKMAND
jgi:hypothetical protein